MILFDSPTHVELSSGSVEGGNDLPLVVGRQHDLVGHQIDSFE